MSAVNASINSTSLDAERRSHEPSMEEILASIRRIIADDDALPVARRDKEKAALRPLVEASRREEIAPPTVGADERALAERAAAAEAPSRAPAVVVSVRAEVSEARPEPSAAPALQPLDFWLRPSRRAEPDDQLVEDEPTAEQSLWANDAVEDAPAADEPEARDDAYAAPARQAHREEEAHREEFHREDARRQEADGDEEGVEETASEAAPPLVSADAAVSIASHFQALAASIVINEADLIERYARELLRPMLKQWLDDNLPHLVERLVRAEIERVARGRR